MELGHEHYTALKHHRQSGKALYLMERKLSDKVERKILFPEEYEFYQKNKDWKLLKQYHGGQGLYKYKISPHGEVCKYLISSSLFPHPKEKCIQLNLKFKETYKQNGDLQVLSTIIEQMGENGEIICSDIQTGYVPEMIGKVLLLFKSERLCWDECF